MARNEPGIIDDMMTSDMFKWTERKLQNLPKPVQFRAFSAIRALSWSNRIFSIDLPIPATFTALHATEEAVAAFVTCAKHYKYGDDAKINIRDHQQKATISFLTMMVVNFFNELKPGIAYHKDNDIIALRITNRQNETVHLPGSLYQFSFGDKSKGIIDTDFMHDIVNKYGDVKSIKDEIVNIQNARNKIFYASDDGYPSGFANPREEIRNECKKTLALLWTCVDIHENKNVRLRLVEQALRTAQMVIKEFNKKKPVCK